MKKLKYYFPTSLHHTWPIIARYIVLIGLILTLLTGIASAWYNISLPNRVNLTAPSGTRPYDFNVTISTGVGTNTINASGTFLFCNGYCSSNFSDIVFVDEGNNTAYYHTVLNNTSGEVHINVTQGTTIGWYYGNLTDTTPDSKPYQTFVQYYPYTSGNFYNGSNNVNIPFIWEANVARSAGASQVFYGVSNNADPIAAAADSTIMYYIDPPTTVWGRVNNDAATTSFSDTRTTTNNAYYRYKIVAFNASFFNYYVDNVLIGQITTNLPNEPMSLVKNDFAGDGYQEWSIVMPYAVDTPQFTAVGTEFILYSNNYTNDNSLSLSIPEDTAVRFYDNDTITQWCIDATCIASTANFYDVTFSTIGNYNITGVGSINVTWNVTVASASSFIPTLISPTNGTTISFNYPPQFADVSFYWSQIGSSGYNLMIASDAAFNLIEYNITTSSNSSTYPLVAGTHYWKVRTYNTGIPEGTWSDPFYFSFSSVSSGLNGTNINGIIYELINGVQTPIESASVYIVNSSYTAQQQTGTNGYFLFTDLAPNVTYTLYAIKQNYDNSQYFYVNTTYNATTTVNIPMRIFVSPYIPNWVFEKFSIRSLFDKPYPGVTVTIYKGTSLTVSASGLTDSMGQYTAQLFKDQYYRAEFSGGGLSSTITKYFYAKEEEYLLTIIDGFPTIGDLNEDINATLTVSTFNATYSNLSIVYNDTRSSTTALNFYATNLTNNATCTQTSASQVTTLNCTVLAAGTYQFGFNATSTIYGFFQQDKIVNFGAGSYASQPQVIGTKIPADMLNWISILLLIFVGGFFSVRNVKIGSVIVPLMALTLWWFKALQVEFIFISIVVVFGVVVYIRGSEGKVQYQ